LTVSEIVALLAQDPFSFRGRRTVEALLTVDSHVEASLAIAACQARENKPATTTTAAAKKVKTIFGAGVSMVLSYAGDS
jgi:hypothetical protein